jgi:hydroxyacylglutathione hydrolase
VPWRSSWRLPIEGPQREESFWIDQLPQQSRSFGFPPAQAFSPDRWLEDGDCVTVGKQTLAVIHAPGHTPGHVVFFHAPTKLAIVGDVLFAGSDRSHRLSARQPCGADFIHPR